MIPVQPVEPVPVYPEGHDPQVNEPALFVHVVNVSQAPFDTLHSLMSEQVV